MSDAVIISSRKAPDHTEKIYPKLEGEPCERLGYVAIEVNRRYLFIACDEVAAVHRTVTCG